MAAAINVKDYSYFISKAEALAQGAVDTEIKARARFSIGEAYCKKGDIEQARIAFQAVLTQYPETTFGKEGRRQSVGTCDLYKDQGVVVIGISLDEDLKPVQEMVSSKGITWPQVQDADKS